jgi:hypothetical protein
VGPMSVRLVNLVARCRPVGSHCSKAAGGA